VTYGLARDRLNDGDQVLDAMAQFISGNWAQKTGEMRGIGMSASEVMMRSQLDRIIARIELRVEQHKACVGSSRDRHTGNPQVI
jgi:hypothetical protein